MSVILTSKPACVICGILAVAIPLKALTSADSRNIPAAATPSPSSASSAVDDGSNPYAIIVDRNVFHLNPPPPPVAVKEKPADIPKVYLNGIIKVGSDIRVLFSIPSKDAKTPTSYFKLGVNEKANGEKDDVLELVNIHPNHQEVDVVINGTHETLSVASNSMGKISGEAPAQARPGPVADAGPGGGSVIVAGGSSTPANGGGGGGITTIGGGVSQASSGGGSGVTVAGGYNPGAGGGGQLASALMSSAPSLGQVANPNVQAPPSVEAQAVGMLSDATTHPSGPPLPPELAQMIGQDTGPVATPRGGGGANVSAPPVPGR